MYNLVLIVCESFPSINNGRKIPRRSVKTNSTHSTEVSVEYICNSGFVYSLENPIVNCTKDGLKNKVGNCVRGYNFIFNYF